MALFQVLPDVLFWVKNREGKFMMVNAAFAEMLQRDADDLIGMTDSEVYPEAMAGIFSREDKKVIETREPFWNKLELVTRKLGGVEWKMTSKIPLEGKDGSIVGTAGICRRVEGMGGRDATGKKLPKQYQALMTLVEYVEENVDQNLTIQGVSKAMGMSVATLERRFMKHFATTPKKYFLQARMSVACDRLLNSPLSVGEIAESLGYKEHAAFTRAFQTVVNLSPSEYRKHYKV